MRERGQGEGMRNEHKLWALRRFSVRVGQVWPGYKRKTFDAVLCASLYICVCVCAVARVCEGGVPGRPTLGATGVLF